MVNINRLGKCIVTGKTVYRTNVTLTGNSINLRDWKDQTSKWKTTKT